MIEHRDLGFMPEGDWKARFEDSGDDRAAFDIVRVDPQSYPLRRIIEIAESVGRGVSVRKQQTSALADQDSCVRYWAAVGCLAQSSIGEEATGLLKGLLKDRVPSCRIAAAESLLEHDVESRDAAVKVLVEVARSENYYARLLAINALHRRWREVKPAEAEALRFLLAEKPNDWIDRSIQATVWTLLTRPREF